MTLLVKAMVQQANFFNKSDIKMKQERGLSFKPDSGGHLGERGGGGIRQHFGRQWSFVLNNREM